MANATKRIRIAGLAYLFIAVAACWATSLTAAADNFITIAQARATEAPLRRVIAELQSGSPDYSQMEPMLSTAVKQQLPAILPLLKQLGALQSVTFQGQQQGADVYDVRFANGANVWAIALSPSGRISFLVFQ